MDASISTTFQVVSSKKYDLSKHISTKFVVTMIGRSFCGLAVILPLAFLLGVLAHGPDSNFKIFCYQQIYPDSNIVTAIETDLCTHIVYFSIELDPTKLTLRFVDNWTGFNHKYRHQVTAYQAKGIKVLV